MAAGTREVERIGDTFAFLLGSWRVERRFVHTDGGLLATFVGVATFVCEGGEGVAGGAGDDKAAAYGEVGELCAGSYRSRSTRRLVGHRGPEGQVEFRFLDGHPFVPLDLSAGQWQAEHRCGEDHYLIETEARSRSVVDERWQVRGPRDNYDALTTLVRQTLDNTELGE